MVKPLYDVIDINENVYTCAIFPRHLYKHFLANEIFKYFTKVTMSTSVIPL